ncbi:MAG: alpha/beta hydrolase family protein [Candidatus Omnitrophica bacterium]|nr:alpha/beta hydrolase family protein [Candidatus Omnitrophota bacterium]MCM8802150.1 alpha/beta hydrolase family protein [Candidatus Omnitrophota bacterium]
MPNRIDSPQITDNFIEKWAKSIRPELEFNCKTEDEFYNWKKRLINKIKELLGEFPQPSDLKPEKLSEEEKEKYIREKWIIQTEKDCFMPLYILIPKENKKKYPAILCCHGHGPYGKDPVAGVHNNNSNIINNIKTHNYNYGEQMAENGFVTIVPDWRSFGERIGYYNIFQPRDICNIHFLQHLILGRTLLGVNIFDGMRAIDFLLTKDYVDKENIGCMGLSFGGTMTTYLTLLDDRIKAADIICYATTTLHYAIERPNFCGSQIVPFLYKYADVGDVIAAICPKPLLIESGANDTCFWIDSAKKAHEKVIKAYKVAKASENLWIEVFPGEHSFSGNLAFKFFNKYLNK